MAKTDKDPSAAETAVAEASANRNTAALESASVDIPEPAGDDDAENAVVKAVCADAARQRLNSGDEIKIVVQREGLVKLAEELSGELVVVDRKMGAVALWRVVQSG